MEQRAGCAVPAPSAAALRWRRRPTSGGAHLISGAAAAHPGVNAPAGPRAEEPAGGMSGLSGSPQTAGRAFQTPALRGVLAV